MKKFLLAIAFLAAISASAQNNQDFLQRYNRLVSRVGFAGVGVDNLLNNWYKSDSLDMNVIIARFNYHYALSESDTVVSSFARKHLGNDPIMTLKDSLGRNVNYFKESLFDETQFGNALRYLDKAIALDNTRLDLCILRANALLAFEKSSPDLTLAYLKEIATKNYSKKYKWSYPGKDLEEGFFCSLMQDYCYEFYNIATTQGYEAFRDLSQIMVKYEPKSTHFVNNIGSYYFVGKGNAKSALKYYKKALKIDPDDEVAKKNIALIEARSKKKK